MYFSDLHAMSYFFYILLIIHRIVLLIASLFPPHVYGRTHCIPLPLFMISGYLL